MDEAADELLAWLDEHLLGPWVRDAEPGYPYADSAERPRARWARVVGCEEG